MSTVLQRGQHFGTTTARGEAPGASLTCLGYAHARKLPAHAHESAFFTMLLRGGYRERAGSREIDYDPLTVVFHPPSHAHFDEIGAGDSELVTVEVSRAFFEDYDVAPPPLARQSFDAARRMLSLYHAARAGVLTPLDVESGVIELLGDAAKVRDVAELTSPAWLPRVLEKLREDGDLRVADLAYEANVHPVHFTRTFRRRVGMTPGAYLQRVRLQSALRQLASGASLSDAAFASGFADQSHFSRAARATLGMTPRMLAALLRSAG